MKVDAFGRGKMTPNNRSRLLLISQGYEVDVAESFNYFTKRRKDAFGFADLLAIDEEHNGTLYVQVTTSHNMLARLKKIISLPISKKILESDNRIHIHGWYEKTGLWGCKIREVTIEDFI
jgi:hypothetical protein